MKPALSVSMSVVAVAVGALGVGCVESRVTTSLSTDSTVVNCVRSVTVQPAAMTLHVGDTARFEAGACGVTGGWRWRATDTLVVTVLDTIGGLVRARGVGVTSLTARAVSDSNVRGAALITGIAAGK